MLEGPGGSWQDSWQKSEDYWMTLSHCFQPGARGNWQDMYGSMMDRARSIENVPPNVQWMYLQDGLLGLPGLGADLGRSGGELWRGGKGRESLHRLQQWLRGLCTRLPVLV